MMEHHEIKAYIDILASLKDGEEITFGEVTIKRIGNGIWQKIFIYYEEDDNGNIVTGAEEEES